MSSPIDDLFEEIFGFKPAKDGTAFELLSAAVCKLLESSNEIYHDEKLRGQLSKSLYQIDVLLKDGKKQIFGEAKDYTDRDAKVGRGDIQKLAGAIVELEVDGARFFSATDYTKPAKQYAGASSSILGKEIELFHIRPSVAQDEDGRIKTIIVNIHVTIPNYQKAKFMPILTDNGKAKLDKMAEEGSLANGQCLCIRDIVDANGNIVTNISNLTRSNYGGIGGETATGSFLLPGGHIELNGELIEIKGITYEIPFDIVNDEIVIEADGTPKLLLKDEKGTVNKLITDASLKKIRFADDGEVTI